jgi:outer membrane protein OmpA-like peptidoglycan-associated protein
MQGPDWICEVQRWRRRAIVRRHVIQSRSGGSIVSRISLFDFRCFANVHYYGDGTMNGGVKMRGRGVIPVALVCAVALLSGGGAARAEDKSEADIVQALTGSAPQTPPKPAADPAEAVILQELQGGTSRAPHKPAVGAALSPAERKIIEGLINKEPRSITPEERRMVADAVSHNPSIDLPVNFDYNEAGIGPKAVPQLMKLGRALENPQLEGARFVIEGHTDGAGSVDYNQKLSELRAANVKAFLVENFNLPPGRLLAVGFGQSRLKNAAEPRAAENRRVQIVKWQ